MPKKTNVQEIPKQDVKLTVEQIFTLFPIAGEGPLQRFYNEGKFRPSVGMRLLAVTDSLKVIADRAYKLRKDIFEKYGETKEDGTIQIAIPGQDGHDPEKWEAFEKELLELNAVELEFPGFDRTLKLVDIAEKADLRLSLADLKALKPIFAE